jgi:hypothetical protein
MTQLALQLIERAGTPAPGQKREAMRFGTERCDQIIALIDDCLSDIAANDPPQTSQAPRWVQRRKLAAARAARRWGTPSSGLVVPTDAA